MKEIFKQIIIKNQELDLKVIVRDFVFPITKKIVSLIGLRRVGKSYILFSKINELKEQNLNDKIIYINFDDERIGDLKKENLDDILKGYYELYPDNIGEKLYLFFDEIQNVDSWSLFVKRLYETQKYEIYITGSSSKLLSKEIATELRGRTLSFYIYPLSFIEFLRFNNFEYNNKIIYSNKIAQLKLYFKKYLEWGGFPELINEELKIETINSYLDLTIYKDLIERYNIKNYKLIKNLIKYLITNYSKEFSVNSYYKIIKQELKLSRETIYDYLSYLEDANFVYFLNKFDYSLKNQELGLKKIYISDLAFAKLGFQFSENIGRNLENLIFIELKRRNKQIYYHKKEKECDFVILEKNKIIEVIQVTYNLLDPDTKKREISGLVNAMKTYELKSGIILTYDEENEFIEENNYGKFTIKVIPVWKWLLN